MQPAALNPKILGVDESPQDHPCADVRLYDSDIALLNYLLQDLRVLVRRMAKHEIKVSAHQSLLWEVHGLNRRTVVCDPTRLLRPDDFLMVGFLGDRRARTGSGFDEAELDIIEQLRSHPGILSYSSIELVDDQWANLVVHTQTGDREAWRHSDVHISAAEILAPKMYHSVRIHNGCIRGGVIGSETVVIESTKYWDYDARELWHAMRRLPGGATETVDRPHSGPE